MKESRRCVLSLLFAALAHFSGAPVALANAVAPQAVTANWAVEGQHLDLFLTAADGSAISSWWEQYRTRLFVKNLLRETRC